MMEIINIQKNRPEESLDSVRRFIKELGKQMGGLIMRPQIKNIVGYIRPYLYILEKQGEIQIYSTGTERRHIHAIAILDKPFKKKQKVVKVFSFIDYQNFFDQDRTVVFRYNFFALLGILFKFTEEEFLTVAKPRIYFKKQKNQNDEWPIYKRLEFSGFNIKHTDINGLDVDSLMNEDILALKDEDDDLILNIVSGDIDFFPSAKVVKESLKYRGKRTIIRIFSWEKKLNKEWENLADEIYFLDDYVRFYDFQAIIKHDIRLIDLPDFFLHKSEQLRLLESKITA